MKILVNNNVLDVAKIDENEFQNIYVVTFDNMYISTMKLINKREDEVMYIKTQLQHFLNTNELLSTMGNDKELPSFLLKYVTYAIKNNKSNNVLLAFMLDYNKFKKRIMNLLVLAAQRTGISINELLERTDLHIKDQSQYRIQNALGEIRSINLLHDSEFYDIELIKSENELTSDIIAFYKGEKFTFDVSTSPHFDDQNRFDNVKEIVEKIEAVYQTKKMQLDFSKDKFEANYAGIIILLDQVTSMTALNSQEEFNSFFDFICSKISFTNEAGLILLVGELIGIKLPIS